MERIVVYPMSGYINRLQAMASAALLAEDLDASVHYCWVPFPLVPVGPEDVFATTFVEGHFIGPDEAESWCGRPLDDVPRYVGVDRQAGLAWLRGHDRGEQALLPSLMDLLTGEPSVRTLVIVAGGAFGLGDPQGVEARRRLWYRALTFSPPIEERVAAVRAEHPETYMGLHLRYTDRSLQAPSDSAVRRALESLASSSGLRSLLIASDTADARTRWTDEARALGLEPWSVEPEVLDRTDPRSSTGALVDWRLLTFANRMVYFASSSFAAEAACAGASHTRSLALRPSWLQAGRLRAATWARAAGRRAHRTMGDGRSLR